MFATVRAAKAQMNRSVIFLSGVLVASAVFGLGRFLGRDAPGTFVTATAPATEHNWRLTVGAGTGRHTLAHGESSLAPAWSLRAGWFVYLESATRAWWFNGDDQLILFVPGTQPGSGAFSLDHAPFAVPDAVVRRVGLHRIQLIAANARATRERLGLTAGPTP